MPPQTSSPVTASPPAEPRAEQRPLERTLHDVRLVDEYAWLKAENWREVMRDPSQLDPAIRAYLQAENDYCERALADTKSLQDTLFAEMKGRIKEDDSSVPKPDGPYAYYARYRQGGQHPLLCRQPRDSADIPSAPTADSARDPEKWGPVFGKDHAQTGSLESQEQLLLDGDALARGSPTPPAPSSTLRGCATSTPAPTSPTSCPTYPAQWFGRRTPRPSTMCGSTRATDPPASFAMSWVRRWPRMYACSPRPIRVFSFQSTAICRDASAIFRRTIMRHRKRGSLILPH